MRLNITHTTKYAYSEPATLGHNQLRLTPRHMDHQRCLRSRITVEPFPSVLRTWTDHFGNDVTYFTLEEPHEELLIHLDAVVEVNREPELPDDPSWREAAERLMARPDVETRETAIFALDSPLVRRFEAAREYAAPSFEEHESLAAAVRNLTHRIHRDFRFDPRATTVSTTTAELLETRRGVCQDFAHLQIACLRSWGLAARYMSGYLLTRPPPGQAKLVGADASHAWVSVYFPDHGWIDFDPTNDCLPRNEHIVLAWGRDYADIAPIKGLFLGGGNSRLSVAVDVTPVG